jgi:hypothetical protein
MQELFPKERTAPPTLEAKPVFKTAYKAVRFYQEAYPCWRCYSCFKVLLEDHEEDFSMCVGCELKRQGNSFILDGYVFWVNQRGQLEFARL